MTPLRRTRARSRDGERGAVIVEFSFVALFLFALAAGMYNYGQAWRAGIAITDASRTGARSGSAGGDARTADFLTFSSIKASLRSSGLLSSVDRVVIYRSSTPDGKVPQICKTGSSEECHTLTGAALRTAWEQAEPETAVGETGCLPIAVSSGWCPTTRNRGTATAEYLGVWIRATYQFEITVFDQRQTIERSTTMRLEPRE